MLLTKRKDGRWCKSKTINGDRVYFYSTEPTEKKAIKDIENQMVKYAGKIQKGKLFKDVADEWEKEHYEHIQYQTMYRYKSLTARIVDYFGDSYIKKISASDISLFLETMVSEQFSTKTIKDETSILKMIFKFAAVKKYITENVMQYINPPKGQPKKERQALTNDEMKIIENNIDKEFGLLAYFLLYSGLRRGEVLALEWEDIDFKDSCIKVTKSVEFIGCSPRLKSPKTSAGKRIVPMIDRLKKVLNKRKATGIVFNQDGHYMNSSYFERHWKKYKNETGLTVSPHQLRHTFATLLYEWDISDKDTQEILGHSDISTTRNIYTHIRKSRLNYTLQKMNNRCQNVVK